MAHVLVKPHMNYDEVIKLLEELLEEPIEKIEEAPTGKVKKVYFFQYKDKEYVIRFSDDDMEFKFEKYLQETLRGKKFPLPKFLSCGIYNNLYYAISEKVAGNSIHTLDEKELKAVMPSVIETLIKLHSIDITAYEGYGWLDYKMKGTFNIFFEFLQSFFSKDQEGFWQGWYELFSESFLDYNVFNALYERMMELAKFCEGRRYLTHSDFHYSNIIINNSEIAGVIDWGKVSYCDYIFDIATLILEFPDYNLLEKFHTFYKESNFDTSNFTERFLCAAICNSLDGMRFWAKFGRQEAYKSILDNILMILNKYDFKSE
ncbi:phosphotransferase family protein [Clostridium fungisolvens]|uniref:Hygromycin-B 4-O-kinase n=1 Tax=Clostridium fungisolvens TaxID=1604897 RepID=A0A6V8SL01_9CLOT|nr:phosphotransferase [Clostridium fungisolvens]GFP75563.1 Hygromycin-B 4-O-kinase [Clostridium fungisolvens]